MAVIVKSVIWWSSWRPSWYHCFRNCNMHFHKLHTKLVVLISRNLCLQTQTDMLSGYPTQLQYIYALLVLRHSSFIHVLEFSCFVVQGKIYTRCSWSYHVELNLCFVCLNNQSLIWIKINLQLTAVFVYIYIYICTWL